MMMAFYALRGIPPEKIMEMGMLEKAFYWAAMEMEMERSVL